MSKVTLSIVLLFLFFSCSAVPDDAPSELHQAKHTLGILEDSNVKQYLPRTVARAREHFEMALQRYKNTTADVVAAENAAVKEAEKDAVIKDAVASITTSEGALSLRERLKQWDIDEPVFQQALVMLDQLENEDEVAPQIAQEGNEAVMNMNMLQSPFAKLTGTELTSHLAFFDTNKVTPIYHQMELDALASILIKEPKFNVVLTGNADIRGSGKYNEKLAKQRSERVAKDLKQLGVPDDQITYISMGEKNAQAGSKDVPKLQLDRNVKATLIIR